MTARRKQLEREAERLIDPETEMDVSQLTDLELQGVVNSAGHAQVFKERFGTSFASRRRRVKR